MAIAAIGNESRVEAGFPAKGFPTHGLFAYQPFAAKAAPTGKNGTFETTFTHVKLQ
jgi:hypothetical protein